jgi:inhibitor of KinA
MNYPNLPYRIFPLGDTAITIDFGNVIDETINSHVLALFHQLRLHPLPGMIEAVPAYSSLTVYYDVFGINKTGTAGKTVYDFLSGQLDERLKHEVKEDNEVPRLVNIPVCYESEFAPDLEYLAKEKNKSVEEVVSIHTSKQYRVYMLGFLPGFAYMGEVDERIVMPRKLQPVTVATGSVGIAGKQTGIYPLISPGGWQIIGRTPLKLFDAAPSKSPPPVGGETSEGPLCLLKPGDNVQFISISKNEFESY